MAKMDWQKDEKSTGETAVGRVASRVYACDVCSGLATLVCYLPMDWRIAIGIALSLSLAGRCLATELRFNFEPFFKELVLQGRFGDEPVWDPGQLSPANGASRIYPPQVGTA